MEGDGAPIPSSPPHDPDFSPVGSPEIDAPHPSLQPAPAPTLTHDLRAKIIKQVEYYLSDENLKTDKFMMKYLAKDKEGFVPVGVIASFRKMKKLTQDRSLIVAALRESSFLVVSSNEKKVKRLHPFLLDMVKDPELCTVLIENLPEDHSAENIRKIFGEAGNIKNVSIRDPSTAKEQRKRTVTEKLLSGKLHALVEYETVEAAEKAVATLNDEQDWRYGMRVKLLKQTAKHGQRKKGWKESDSEKNSSVQASGAAGDEETNFSNEQLADMPDGEVASHPLQNEEHLPKEKIVHQDRNRGRVRRQKYHGSNGQGHGTASFSHVSESSKPPPGPKMPDGTRGFTMGRGRPLASGQN